VLSLKYVGHLALLLSAVAWVVKDYPGVLGGCGPEMTAHPGKYTSVKGGGTVQDFLVEPLIGLISYTVYAVAAAPLRGNRRLIFSSSKATYHGWPRINTWCESCELR